MSGFFGKLPLRGDFVNRDLPKPLLDLFDEWFQQGIQSSKAALGDSWFEYYGVMPIWHFYIGPNVVSDIEMEDAWIGTWIPSADKVNRHFPLLMAAKVPAMGIVDDFFSYNKWLVESGDLLLDGLEGVISFEEFCQACADLEPQPQPSVETKLDEIIGDVRRSLESAELAEEIVTKLDALRPFLSNGLNGVEEVLATEKHEQHLVTDECRNKLIQSTSALFWSEGGENIVEQLVITERLPDAGKFDNFLRGFDARD